MGVVYKASYVGTKGNFLPGTQSINLISNPPVPATSLADETARLSQFTSAFAAASGGATPASSRLDPRYKEINYVNRSASPAAICSMSPTPLASRLMTTPTYSACSSTTVETGARRGVRASTMTASSTVRSGPTPTVRSNLHPGPPVPPERPRVSTPMRFSASVHTPPALAVPALLGNYGTLERGTHRLNGERNFDWTIFKGVNVTEGRFIQLGARFVF